MREEEREKKEERADRNRSPSTIARTRVETPHSDPFRRHRNRSSRRFPQRTVQIKPMIKARFVGSSLPMTQRRAGLFAETPGLSPLRYLVSKLATNKCGEERKCVAVMDVKLDDQFASRFPQNSQGASWMECWQNGLVHCTGHVMLQ